MAALLIFYLFISSLIADLIRIIQKYLIKEKHRNFIPNIHKKGLLAIIIFTVILGLVMIACLLVGMALFDI